MGKKAKPFLKAKQVIISKKYAREAKEPQISGPIIYYPPHLRAQNGGVCPESYPTSSVVMQMGGAGAQQMDPGAGNSFRIPARHSRLQAMLDGGDHTPISSPGSHIANGMLQNHPSGTLSGNSNNPIHPSQMFTGNGEVPTYSSCMLTGDGHMSIQSSQMLTYEGLMQSYPNCSLVPDYDNTAVQHIQTDALCHTENWVAIARGHAEKEPQQLKPGDPLDPIPPILDLPCFVAPTIDGTHYWCALCPKIKMVSKTDIEQHFKNKAHKARRAQATKYGIGKTLSQHTEVARRRRAQVRQDRWSEDMDALAEKTCGDSGSGCPKECLVLAGGIRGSLGMCKWCTVVFYSAVSMRDHLTSEKHKSLEAYHTIHLSKTETGEYRCALCAGSSLKNEEEIRGHYLSRDHQKSMSLLHLSWDAHLLETERGLFCKICKMTPLANLEAAQEHAKQLDHQRAFVSVYSSAEVDADDSWEVPAL